MKKRRVVIKDLNRTGMSTVVDMEFIDMDEVGANMLMFQHEDGSVSIVNMMPGWAASISVLDE